MDPSRRRGISEGDSVGDGDGDDDERWSRSSRSIPFNTPLTDTDTDTETASDGFPTFPPSSYHEDYGSVNGSRNEHLDEQEYAKEEKVKYTEKVAKVTGRLDTISIEQSQIQSSTRTRLSRSGRGHAEISVLGTIADASTKDIINRYSTLPLRCQVNTNLAVYGSKAKILASLPFRQIFIIEGFTGCGKTTQVPQFIMDDCVKKGEYCRIAVTQPRRIAAISVANRVSEERGWEFERSLDYSIIGYQVGMDKKCNDQTLLTYMTTGVLLQKIIARKNLDEWTHILIDEVHERDLDTDLLCLIINKLLIETNNTTTKIFLMSATLNVDKFADYFPSFIIPQYKNKFMKEEKIPNESRKDESYVRNGALIVKIQPHKQHNIVEHFIDDFVGYNKSYEEELIQSQDPMITEETFKQCVRIIEALDSMEKLVDKDEANVKPTGRYSEVLDKPELKPGLVPDDHIPHSRRRDEMPKERGAVLIFLPGLYEIDMMILHLQNCTMEKAKDFNGRDKNKWLPLPLHSSITNEEQTFAFRPAPEGYRKIICATNIAESSITVADIKYVIDFCLTKSLSCDPVTNFTCLKLDWASQNQCVQRRGRVGRVSDGHCYFMVSKKFYNNLKKEALPEMQTAALESVVLSVKLLDMGSPDSLLALALDPPDISGIKRAVVNLKEIGALTLLCRERYDSKDGDLTHVGEILAQLPIDTRLGRFIILGHVFGLLNEAIIIACGLSTKPPFSYPYDRRLEAYLSRLTWSSNSFSDCFAVYNLFKTWETKWQQNFFKRNNSEYKWAKMYYVQTSVMREMKFLKDELIKRLERFNIVPTVSPLSTLSMEQGIFLKIIIGGAFYPNYFLRPKPNLEEFERDVYKEVVTRNPLYTVTFQGFPPYENGRGYAERIAKIFKSGRNVPFVDFYGSKVILTFDSRSEKIGLVSLGVYKAVKMRHIRQGVSFKAIKPVETKDVSKEKQDVTESEEKDKVPNPKKEKVLKKKEKPILNEHDIFICPIQERLPDARENHFGIYVTNVENPGEFWVIRKENSVRLNEMANMLQQAVDSHDMRLFPLAEKRNVSIEGLLCIVRSNSNKFARARIDCDEADVTREGYNDNEVLVFLVDYGETVWRNRNELYAFPERMIQNGYHRLECMAIQCRLQELKGFSKDSGQWLPMAALEMIGYINASDKLILSVYAILDSVIICDITYPGCSFPLTQALLIEKVGQRVPEPFNVQYMAERRRKLQTDPEFEMMNSLIEEINKEQMAKFFGPQKYETVQDDESGKTIDLRGGFSPLELKFNAVSQASNMKQIVIDGNSVNSVALDQEPFSTCAKFVVAHHVGIAQKTGNVILRNTTLMPSIPGLIGLVTMIFSPRVEFRIDSKASRYTGVLSGLGIHPVKKVAIHPDHDVEIVFDTEIDNRDIELINSIRMSMNLILSRERTKNLAVLQKKMQMDLLALLEREREAIEETWPRAKYAWGLIDKKRILAPGHRQHIPMRPDPFPLHNVVKFASSVEIRAQEIEDEIQFSLSYG